MNSFRVSPGCPVFMKVSPMRKPRKPAARRRQMVSGSEMPLSETRSGAQLPGYPEGILHIGDERAEVAVVDTNHVGFLIYIGEFRRAVDFEQYLQPEFVGLGGESAALLRTKAGGNEQYRVGTYDAGLQKLVLVDDEVFAQNGDVDERTDCADVAQRTAKELLIRQDGEGSGAGGFVGGGYLLCPGSLVYPAFGG